MSPTPFVIQRLRAFVSVDADGSEGVCAWRSPDGTWMPLVAADDKRFTDCEHLARLIAKQSGRTIRVLDFTTRTQIGVIQP